MKVLFLTEFYPTTAQADVRGGVELRTFFLSQSLSQRHEVAVVAVREYQTTAESRVGRVTVFRPGPVAAFRQAGSYLSRMRYLLAARKKIAGFRPDIIVAENYLAYAILLTLPSSSQHRTILTYHDVWVGSWIQNGGLFMGLAGELIERLVFRRSWRKYVANSEVTKGKLISAGVHPDNIVVIPNGIDQAAIDRIPAEHFTSPTIITVARLVSYKRIDDLLHALALVLQRVPNVRLVTIGSGPEEKNLKALAAELGVAKQVDWRGFVKNYQEVLAAVKGAAVFSLPSAVEGFGIVTLEAMACGTPFVNSDIAPTREVTGPELAAALYPLGDVAALADKLVAILSSPSIGQEQAAVGRRRATYYAWDDMSARFQQCLETVQPHIP